MPENDIHNLWTIKYKNVRKINETKMQIFLGIFPGIFLGHFGKLTSCDFSDILDLFTGILVLDKSRIFTKFSDVLPLTMFKG